MRSLWLLIISFFTIGKDAFSIQIPEGYRLLWNSEFDSYDDFLIEWNKSPDCNGCGNNELQFYENGSENLKVENGALKIIAHKENKNGKRYTSGKVSTKYKLDFQYGRVEIRAKLPYGQGIWPAFWMMPTNSEYGGWPRSGEIDIVEAINLKQCGLNKIHGTMHYGAAWNNKSQKSGSKIINNATDYHIYAIDWTYDKIKWYIDGIEYHQANFFQINNRIPANAPAPFNKDFYLILNLAVGGNWPGSPNELTRFPQTFELDYVRVFQKQ